VKVEDITRVSLATWRTTEEEGHLTVGNSLLGEIVVNDESVLTVVTEVLTDNSTGVWGKELEWSRLGGGGSNDGSVAKSTFFLKGLHDLGDSGALLADSDVDTVETVSLWHASGETSLLVDDGIDGDGSLTGLTVTDDKLALTTADRHEDITGLDT